MGFFNRSNKKKENSVSSSEQARDVMDVMDAINNMNNSDSQRRVRETSRQQGLNIMSDITRKNFEKSKIGEIYQHICTDGSYIRKGLKFSSDPITDKIEELIKQFDMNGYDGLEVLKLPYLYEKEGLGILYDGEKRELQALREKCQDELHMLSLLNTSIRQQHESGMLNPENKDASFKMFSRFYAKLVELGSRSSNENTVEDDIDL